MWQNLCEGFAAQWLFFEWPLAKCERLRCLDFLFFVSLHRNCFWANHPFVRYGLFSLLNVEDGPSFLCDLSARPGHDARWRMA